MSSPVSLERFIQAQEKGGSYERAFAELKAGRKTGHWIWWVFPQSRGLGTSERSMFYGLINGNEAHAYFLHPVLGPRYRECVAVVHGHLCQGEVAPLVLMGSDIDVLKLRSSLALFLKAAPDADETLRLQAKVVLSVLG